jgi:hypothetical protein
MDCQRGGPALPAGRVGGGPVISIDRVTGVQCPRRAYRGLKVFRHSIGHVRNSATARTRQTNLAIEAMGRAFAAERTSPPHPPTRHESGPRRLALPGGSSRATVERPGLLSRFRRFGYASAVGRDRPFHGGAHDDDRDQASEVAGAAGHRGRRGGGSGGCRGRGGPCIRAGCASCRSRRRRHQRSLVAGSAARARRPCWRTCGPSTGIVFVSGGIPGCSGKQCPDEPVPSLASAVVHSRSPSWSPPEGSHATFSASLPTAVFS